MNVLIACEYSGTVREEFLKFGHNAISCDILPSDIPGPHVSGDVTALLEMEWDLIIAHPPCTFLCNSGVRWLKDNVKRQADMANAAIFFEKCLNGNSKKICVENPIPHKYAADYIGKYTQIIQPWQFGHGETKATCLWLKGLPNLKPSNIAIGRENRIHKLPPSKDRSKLRSLTYKGIAKAMATQWGTSCSQEQAEKRKGEA